MLAVGIPEYRLPKDVLGREIDYVRQMGVDIRLNSPIGPGMTINDLLTRDGYQAVFVGIGATQAVRLPVPGAEAEGVLWGVDYLKDVRLGGALLWPGNGWRSSAAAMWPWTWPALHSGKAPPR